MIPWVCIFYSVHENGQNVKERLVYRGTDFEKKTDRNAILKMVIQQGLGDISGLDKIIEQEMEHCRKRVSIIVWLFITIMYWLKQIS